MYVVRGPVSAGLRTRTPGVGLKSRAVAAVAVARRRSIMGGQHARSSVRGGRRAALSRGIGGRRPGPPLVVRGAPSTGFRGRWQPVFTSEALLPGEPVVRCCSNTGAIPAPSSSRGQPCADASLGSCSSGRRPRAASRLCASDTDEPAEAMATTMRGTGSAQVQLIHKAPTTLKAAATAPLTRSPPAPAATPPRRCSVGTG